jgi:hypothetical protein
LDRPAGGVRVDEEAEEDRDDDEDDDEDEPEREPLRLLEDLLWCGLPRESGDEDDDDEDEDEYDDDVPECGLDVV